MKVDVSGGYDGYEDEDEEEVDPVKLAVATVGALHEANSLKSTQSLNAKDYMQQVSYSVPIDKLYQVIDSCNFSTDLDFCPVMLKIVDDKIIEENGGKAYLMQVWTNKGELAYERKLDRPVENWNISTDKLLFHEREDSDYIYVVKLREREVSTLFELKLPRGTIDHVVQSDGREEEEEDMAAMPINQSI